MDTPTLKAKVKNLQREVQPYSDTNPSFLPFDLDETLNSAKLYYIIPLILFVLLIAIRPSFLYVSENRKDQAETSRKFSFKKLFLWWLLLSSISSLGIFGYRYKKEN